MRRVLALLTLAIAACGGGGGIGEEGKQAESGTFDVYLTDAPVEGVTAVRIQVRGVQFVTDTSEEGPPVTETPEPEVLEPETEPEGTDQSEGALTFDPPRELNLIELRGNKVELGEVTVTGTISQVRLLIDGTAEVEFEDGRTETARVPSGAETGLKIVTEPVDPTEIDDLTIDFDAQKSLVQAGSNLLLKPTLQAFADDQPIGESTPGGEETPAAEEPTEPVPGEPTEEPVPGEPDGTVEPTPSEPGGTAEEPAGTPPGGT